MHRIGEAITEGSRCIRSDLLPQELRIMIKVERQWYLVHTKPRSEYLARENLGRQGFKTYLPEIRETRRRHGKLVTAVVPMFPRYLFIHLSEQVDNWSPVRSTLGVTGLVRFGQRVARAPDDLILMLKGQEDGEGVQVLPVDRYEPGARIRVVVGGMIGYEGIFMARSNRDRASILLDILGRQIQTAVPVRYLEPAN